MEEARDLNGVADGVPTQWEAAIQTEIKPPNSSDSIVESARLLRDEHQLGT